MKMHAFDIAFCIVAGLLVIGAAVFKLPPPTWIWLAAPLVIAALTIQIVDLLQNRPIKK